MRADANLCHLTFGGYRYIPYLWTLISNELGEIWITCVLSHNKPISFKYSSSKSLSSNIRSTSPYTSFKISITELKNNNKDSCVKRLAYLLGIHRWHSFIMKTLTKCSLLVALSYSAGIFRLRFFTSKFTLFLQDWSTLTPVLKIRSELVDNFTCKSGWHCWELVSDEILTWIQNVRLTFANLPCRWRRQDVRL